MTFRATMLETGRRNKFKINRCSRNSKRSKKKRREEKRREGKGREREKDGKREKVFAL